MTTTPTTPADREAASRHGYSSYQIGLHWTVVGLVVANWLIGQQMEDVFEARERGEAVMQYGPAFVHIALGLAIFFAMVARLVARLQRPVQTAPESKHDIMRRLGQINHWAFYVVLLAMPPVGAIAWFTGSEAAGAFHGLVAWVLLVLVVLHVGGALLHLALGENIIRRMLRSTPGT